MYTVLLHYRYFLSQLAVEDHGMLLAHGAVTFKLPKKEI